MRSFYEFVIDPGTGQDPFPFYLGALDAPEVGQMVVAVARRMENEPPGWSLHIRRLTGPDSAALGA